MKRYLLVMCWVLGAIVLAGCDELVTIETGSAATAPASAQVQATVVLPTIIAPEQMPTAAPLWTDTPVPLQPPAQPAEAAQPQPTLQPALPQGVAALVNGEAISQAAFDAQIQQASTYLLQQPNLDPKTEAGRATLAQLEQQILSLMIDQVLIRQAATQQGIVIQPSQIDAQVAKMQGNDQTRFEAWLASNGMTEQDLRQQITMDLFTAAVRDQVTGAMVRETPHLRVRHILISEQTRAVEAQRRLQAGENFIAVAREYSEDTTTRESGGDLGFVPKGVMPPRFDEAAFALQPGQISQIIQSPAGYQIIQLVEIDPNRRIADRFWPQMQQRAFEEWLNQQRTQALIQTSGQ